MNRPPAHAGPAIKHKATPIHTKRGSVFIFFSPESSKIRQNADASEHYRVEHLKVQRQSFDPENPTGIDNNSSVEVRNSANKIVLSFNVTECNILKPGTYRGTLKLFPSFEKFGALIIEPSQFQMELRKTGFLRTYLWKILLGSIILFIVLLYLSNKIRRRLPIKV